MSTDVRSVVESSEFIRVFSDRSVERFIPETAAASVDLYPEYKCKDLVIDPLKPVTARIFVPTIPTPPPTLPVVVYFHGGGFCIGSTTWLGYHHFLGDLSVASRSIVLSVDYRLAPEHRLPTAYEDSYASLVWLKRKKLSEPWLEKADLTRVFLSGDSAGGNIVHHVALRAVRDQTCPVSVKGVLPIHPYFGSERRTELETEAGSEADVASNDMFWRLSVPEGSDRDYEGCNLETAADVAPDEWRRFPDVAVYVAELDFLRERGVAYTEFLKRKGVRRVGLVETKGEGHVFHVFRPDSEPTRVLQKQMSGFIHGS